MGYGLQGDGSVSRMPRDADSAADVAAVEELRFLGDSLRRVAGPVRGGGGARPVGGGARGGRGGPGVAPRGGARGSGVPGVAPVAGGGRRVVDGVRRGPAATPRRPTPGPGATLAISLSLV